MASHDRLELCLASPHFYPTHGGASLQFLRYLPGLRNRGIEARVLAGTPSTKKLLASEVPEEWRSRPIGEFLPAESVNGTPIQRRRSAPFNNSIAGKHAVNRINVLPPCPLERPEDGRRRRPGKPRRLGMKGPHRRHESSGVNRFLVSAAHDDRLELVFAPGRHVSGSEGNGLDEGPPSRAVDVKKITDGLEIVMSRRLTHAVVPLRCSC
jgi:hypothetical protein